MIFTQSAMRSVLDSLTTEDNMFDPASALGRMVKSAPDDVRFSAVADLDVNADVPAVLLDFGLSSRYTPDGGAMIYGTGVIFGDTTPAPGYTSTYTGLAIYNTGATYITGYIPFANAIQLTESDPTVILLTTIKLTQDGFRGFVEVIDGE